MSMRRFVLYFLALSAGSTVAFASCLTGPAALPEAVPSMASSPRGVLNLMAFSHGRHKHVPKTLPLTMAE